MTAMSLRSALRGVARLPGAVLDRTAGLFPLVGVLLAASWLFRPGPAGGAPPIIGAWYRPLVVLALLQVAYFVFQTVLWLLYRPVAPAAGDAVPFLSVIIPAYNEGPMVERSIDSVAAADYPHDRLEIIVVDDGSRDDTFFHMERLRRAHPALVRLVRFAGNRGKRAALAAGFRAARGEIVLTLDSDSEVEAGTLRAMVAPFRSPRVGGVAGKVTVLNRHHLIGAMLDVQYSLAFDFGRAAQSTFRAVACCPGALSAFRREVVVPHLDGWLGQRFLGRPVAHGEDQALTNIVLRAGYDTLYQSTASIRTLAPTRYRQLTRMFLRWERSYVVEGFSFARFMFTRWRPDGRVLPAINFFFSNLRLVLLYGALVQFPLLVLRTPWLIPGVLAATAVTTSTAALYYLRRERSLRFLYGVLYGFYALLLLQWILPWAVVTVRDERWGTR